MQIMRNEENDPLISAKYPHSHYILQTPKPTVAPSSMTHFDKMAALTHRGFTALVSQIRNESFAGRKVIAGLVMKRSETNTGILVSLGTGELIIVKLSILYRLYKAFVFFIQNNLFIMPCLWS